MVKNCTVDNKRQILAVGENAVFEFKRCGNGIKYGTYKNILDGEADVPINVPINVLINVPINGSKKTGGYLLLNELGTSGKGCGTGGWWIGDWKVSC